MKIIISGELSAYFLGGRIFSCLVYNFHYYSAHILEILIPFKDGQFIGFAGMAYHGAVIGVFLVSFIYVKVKKLNFRELCDLVFPVIPLGYTLGRIANFINQELWGRVTDSSFGVLFSTANKVPLQLNNVQEIINKIGWKIDLTTNVVTDNLGRSYDNLIGNVIDSNGNLTNILGINLPRFPSQLFEAFFEGIVLFLIIWYIGRKFKPFKGFLAPLYLVGYSICRFFLEFLREPDNEFANILAGKYTGYAIGNISMGQILSIITDDIWSFVGNLLLLFIKKGN